MSKEKAQRIAELDLENESQLNSDAMGLKQLCITKIVNNQAVIVNKMCIT